MKNRLTDLNNHLFAQLERLGEESLSAEAIEAEAKRADAIVQVADQIIRNADIHLKAATIIASHGDRMRALMPMLTPGPDAPPAAPALDHQP